MAEKVVELGIERDPDFMYFIKKRGVYRIQRRKPGMPRTKAELVARARIALDLDYIYFLDGDGDIARAMRTRLLKRKKAAAKPKPVAKRKPAAKPKPRAAPARKRAAPAAPAAPRRRRTPKGTLRSRTRPAP
jgi:hypothetical protein